MIIALQSSTQPQASICHANRHVLGNPICENRPNRSFGHTRTADGIAPFIRVMRAVYCNVK